MVKLNLKAQIKFEWLTGLSWLMPLRSSFKFKFKICEFLSLSRKLVPFNASISSCTGSLNLCNLNASVSYAIKAYFFDFFYLSPSYFLYSSITDSISLCAVTYHFSFNSSNYSSWFIILSIIIGALLETRTSFFVLGS